MLLLFVIKIIDTHLRSEDISYKKEEEKKIKKRGNEKGCSN